MNPYDTYKPTGIEWIGEIPEQWEVRKLKYVASINDDALPETTDEDFEIVYVDISSVQVGEIVAKERFKFKEAPSRARRKVKDGDIIVSTVRTYLKAITIIKNPEENLIVSTGFAVVRPQTIESNYLGSLFFSEHLIGEIISRSTGVSYPAITANEIGQIEMPIPPMKEQTGIADYLDQKTTQLDKLIANKQQLIALLKEERTAVINEVLSGEGKNWEKKKLKYVAKKVQTGSTPPSEKQEYYEEEINWFTPSDFSDKLLLTNSKRKLSQLAIEDGVIKIFPAFSLLMVGIGATLAKVGYSENESSSNQQINAISFDSLEKCKFYTFYFYANQQNIVSLANAATLPILNQSQTKDILISVPNSDSTYIKVVDYIEDQLSFIDNTISKIQTEVSLIQEYRTALISEVVTGKIKVI